MYYKKCPSCGANLDPGERCDCEKSRPGWRNTQSGNHAGSHGIAEYQHSYLPQNKEEVNMKTREKMISEIVANLPDLDSKSLEMAWYFVTMPDTETED